MTQRHRPRTRLNAGASPDQAREKLRRWLAKLCFNESGKWLPVPDWAKFYLEIGAALPALEADGSRFVFAISIPIRAYAALLVAAGYTTLSALVPEDAPQDHIRRLQSTELGTPVILYWQGKKYNKARLEEIVCPGGRVEFFGVKPEKGTTVYVKAEDAGSIQFSEREAVKLPKHQTGHDIETPAALLSSLLDGNSLQNFTSCTKLECVVLGQLNLLVQEIQTPVAHQDGSGHYEKGFLQDLLRAHELSRLRKDVSYRSRLLPARASHNKALAEKLSPPVVIFDGAPGFVKWKDVWSRANQVVVLDRSERDYEYGVATINNEYAGRLDGRAPSLPVMPAPAGVEMIFCRLSL
jgi:hypothetical protein